MKVSTYAIEEEEKIEGTITFKLRRNSQPIVTYTSIMTNFIADLALNITSSKITSYSSSKTTSTKASTSRTISSTKIRVEKLRGIISIWIWRKIRILIKVKTRLRLKLTKTESSPNWQKQNLHLMLSWTFHYVLLEWLIEQLITWATIKLNSSGKASRTTSIGSRWGTRSPIDIRDFKIVRMQAMKSAIECETL